MEAAVEFNHFLSSYYPDTSYGADRHYADMLEQAVAAERLGYASVSIPEHHLMNILMNPAPLQMAIKVAGETRRIKIITSVVQLPLHDMRTYAGEVVLAELFTDGRLILGVGRGAFAVEMDRIGVPIGEGSPSSEKGFKRATRPFFSSTSYVPQCVLGSISGLSP